MCSFSGSFEDPETDTANVNNKFIFDMAQHKGIQQKLSTHYRELMSFFTSDELSCEVLGK